MKQIFDKNLILGVLGVTALSLLLVVGLAATGALGRIESIADDWRMGQSRAGTSLDRRLAVILIDDASLQALEPLLGRYPWPRQVYADLIDFLAYGGARATVFDILFAEREAGEGPALSAGDRRLVEAGARGGMAYHAVQFIDDRGDDGEALVRRELPSEFRDRFGYRLSGWAGDGAPYNRYLVPFDALAETAAGIGAVGLEPDPDGVYRRARLFWPYAEHAYPLLGAAPILADRSSPVAFDGRVLRVGLQNLPVDDQGRFVFAMVDDIPAYSIGAVLESFRRLQAGETPLLVEPTEFAGRTVFIGAGAAGLQDVKATALGAKTPGVFIHASIADNLLNRTFHLPASTGVAWMLSALLALITAFAVLQPRALWLQLLTPVILVAVYVGANLAWFNARIVFPLTSPVLAVALSWLFGAAFLAFTEGRDKRRVRTMLGQYVSPDVLRTVMERYRDRVTAEVGTSEELTVLFSDIRGFTSLSENLQAEQVVDLLNIHFSEMTEIVFQHQGTLDKFIGDAMMVFWGAPIPAEDHADRAVAAAIAMYAGLRRVNERLREKQYPTIEIGIGVHTGTMVLGNVGSERKLDYTVVGDNVNLASRLEGLSKFYACPIVISEPTLSKLHEPPPCIPLDLVRVKGRSAPIRIYAPVQPLVHNLEISGARLRQLGESGFQAYLARDWDRAREIYAQIPLPRLSQLFVDRCVRFGGAPPVKEWDGVFTQVSK